MTKRTPRKPDYAVSTPVPRRGGGITYYKIGAAWKGVGVNGVEFIAVELDLPPQGGRVYLWPAGTDVGESTNPGPDPYGSEDDSLRRSP